MNTEFGGVEQVKEHVRDARPGVALDQLAKDLFEVAWRNAAADQALRVNVDVCLQLAGKFAIAIAPAPPWCGVHT